MAEDKRVKITGEVEIKGVEKSASDAAALAAEMKAFREAWMGVAAKIEEAIRALATAKAGAKGTADAVKTVETAAKEAAEGAKDLAEAETKAVTVAKGMKAPVTAAKVELEGATREAKRTTTEVKATADAARKMATEEAKATAAAKTMKPPVEAARTELEKAAREAKRTADEVDKAGKKGNVLKGIFQGIGQGLVWTAGKGIGSVFGSIGNLISDASAVNDAFKQLGARGEKDLAGLRRGAEQLSEQLKGDLLDSVAAVKEALRLGADETTAIDVARAALEEQKLGGLAAVDSIQKSSKLVKGFNLDIREQAGVIALMGEKSREARVDVGALYDAMSSIGPTAKALNISFKEIAGVTLLAMSKGIKGEEEGLQGFRELLDALKQPTAALGEALMQAGVIASESSPAWLQQTEAVAGTRRELEGLNAELTTYARTASELGVLTTEAERRAEAYRELDERRKNGERLSSSERRELKTLEQQLKGYIREMGSYAEVQARSRDMDLKRLPVLEQLETRLRATAEVQKDLAESSARAKLEADALDQTLSRQEASLNQVAGSLEREMPRAVAVAMSAQGLGGFLSQLVASDEAMAELPAQARVLVETLNGVFHQIPTAAGQASGAVRNLSGSIEGLQQSGYQAVQGLLKWFKSLGTTLLGPVIEAGQRIALELQFWLNEPFEDGSTVFSRVAGWTEKLRNTVTSEMEKVANGDQNLSDVLWGWVRNSWDMVLQEIPVLMDDFAAFIERNAGPIQDAMVQVVTAATRAAIRAGKALLKSETLVEFFQPIADWTQGVGPTAQAGMATADSYLNGAAAAGMRAAGGVASTPASMPGTGGGTVASGPASVVTNVGAVNVSGAGDPEAVGDVVIRRLADMQRLGVTGTRRLAY